MNQAAETSHETDDNLDGELTKGQVRYSMFTSFLAWVFSVFDYTIFGALLPVIALSFSWSTEQSLVINTWVSVGVVLVSFTVGPIIDYFGRRNAMAITTTGAAISSGLTALTFSPLYLIIVRAFSGFGVSEQAVNSTYLSEIVDPKRRGFLYSLVQSGWPVGALLGVATISVLEPVIGWKGVFLIGVLPAIIITFLRIKLKETPRFERMKKVRVLMKEGRTEEAKLLGKKYGIEVENSEKIPFIQLFEPGFRKQTILLMCIQCFNWMGVQIFAVLATTVLVAAKQVSFTESLGMLIISNMVGFVGYLTLGWLGDKIGRRETMFISFLAASIAFSIMLFFANSAISVIIFYSIGLGFMNGSAAPLFSYLSESYPTRMRGTAVATINALGPIGALIGAAMFAAFATVFGILMAAFLSGAIALLLAAFTMLGTRRIKPGTELESIAN